MYKSERHDQDLPGIYIQFMLWKGKRKTISEKMSTLKTNTEKQTKTKPGRDNTMLSTLNENTA